mmetsp:Transcript_60396/g.197640  ORF Transcript_60396/g.197640 Transcript_60396/m.197640 type:complete len:200 (+) Transcript_60396:2447-3046(+)
MQRSRCFPAPQTPFPSRRDAGGRVPRQSHQAPSIRQCRGHPASKIHHRSRCRQAPHTPKSISACRHRTRRHLHRACRLPALVPPHKSHACRYGKTGPLPIGACPPDTARKPGSNDWGPPRGRADRERGRAPAAPRRPAAAAAPRRRRRPRTSHRIVCSAPRRRLPSTAAAPAEPGIASSHAPHRFQIAARHRSWRTPDQ